jgi:hypothetical protein
VKFVGRMSLSLLMAANLEVSSAARRKAEDSPGVGDVLGFFLLCRP